MNTIIRTLIKLFFMDTAILAGFFILLYFLLTGIKAIQNGKKHVLTDDNIFSYCARLYPGIIGKHLKFILNLALVLFIIHIIFAISNSFTDYINSVATYDQSPLLAFVIDVIKSLIPSIKPFVVQATIILSVIILGYAIGATIHQLYSNEIEHEKMTNFVEASVPAIVPENDNLDFLNNQDQSIEYVITDSEKKPLPYKPSFKELSFYFGNNLQKGFLGVVKYSSKILIVLLICIGINSQFQYINNIRKIIDNQKRIQELNLTIKNLSKSEGLARISLIKTERTNNSEYPLKTYKIEILSGRGEPIPDQTQEFTLRGNEIYIDAININFDYSEIGKGEKYNIAYPYRVYSETMISDNGIPLACIYKDGKTYPVIYSLETSQIYGMKENIYFKRLAEIFDIIQNKPLSQEMGIRSVIGIATHFVMNKDEVRDMFIEGTGGISVKKHHTLFEKGELESITKD